jgi:hypothetical protein
MTEAHTLHRGHFLRPFTFGPVGVDGVAVWSGDIYLAGWVLTESTGAAAATVQLVDGNDANGIPIATVNLAQGQTSPVMLGGHLLVCQTGLFVRVTAGSILGSVFAADR